MDENLARLNRIFPNSGYVKIPKYNPDDWTEREYDSHYDVKSTSTVWSRKPLSYDEAQQLVDEGYRIGWVVPTGVVCIDVDNKDHPQSLEILEKLLEKFEVQYSYNYSFHGAHLIFKDNTQSIKTDSQVKSAINIQIDTRANKSGYIVLPCNDPHRSWGKLTDVIEDLPYFLKPIMHESNPTGSFIGMADGDGRNDALIRWRFKLMRCNKLSEQQIEKTIRIINENLFATPMTNKELYKTVLAPKKTKEKDEDDENNDKRNKYEVIASEIIAKHDFVSYYDNFYQFNGVYYRPINKIELEKIIHFENSASVTQAGRKEIIEFMKIKTQINLEDFDKYWYKIATQNGILNLVTGELEEANKTEYNTIAIPWKYNGDPVYSPRIDQFMKELSMGDAIKMRFLYQVVGYCLLKSNLFHKFFLFRGEGGTGKSTFTNLIQMLVGENSCSHVSLDNFDKDYYLANLLSKLVNIDDDTVDNKALNNTGKFKSVVSGDIIDVRQIYREVMKMKSYATCIFSCNKLPMIMDKTSGLYRRMILVELNNKVKEPDPQFMQKVTEQDIEYLLYNAVDAIKQALEEGHFIITTSEEELLNLFKRRQSALNEWLFETTMCLQDLHLKSCRELYRQYSEWCSLNGYNKPLSMFSFKDEICSMYDVVVDYEKTDKSMKQIFIKRGDFDPMFKPF